ncbi:MAG TPA: maleylpyruvate isomerase family mycothiol-dependent enzyme [Actinocrinis sp.]|jgi:uncharacterized protein (TIGR03083 family)
MDFEGHLKALREQGPLVVQAAEQAGLDAPTPTCPQWRVADLLAHVGGVHRWATGYIGTGLDRLPTQEERDVLFATPADEELLPWYRDAHRALVSALEAPDAGANTIWSFYPQAPAPIAFWARRQAHEAAIHRADAQIAAGMPVEFDPGFAADGIGELLGGLLARPRGSLVADPPTSLGVSATDAEAEWTLLIGRDSRTAIPERREADCLLRGPARDLYLLLWNRAGVEGIEVRGDSAVLDLWRSKAGI